jgi:hypothetical protein
MDFKKIERYLRVNLLGPGPRLLKKEFTGPRSHKGLETPLYRLTDVTRKSSFSFELTKIVENLINCSGLMFIRSVASNIHTAMHHGEPILEASPLYRATEAQGNR